MGPWLRRMPGVPGGAQARPTGRGARRTLPRPSAPSRQRLVDANRRDLPWRAADRAPWGVLVSEVMYSSTRSRGSCPRGPRGWPDGRKPANLAGEAPGEAVEAVEWLGYPRRAALNLHAAS